MNITKEMSKQAAERTRLIDELVAAGALATEATAEQVQQLLLLSMDDDAVAKRFKRVKRTRKKFTVYGINGRTYFVRRADDQAALRTEVKRRGLE